MNKQRWRQLNRAAQRRTKFVFFLLLLSIFVRINITILLGFVVAQTIEIVGEETGGVGTVGREATRLFDQVRRSQQNVEQTHV